MTPVKLPRLHLKHGAYYYVRRTGGKVVWTRLSASLPEALAQWTAMEAQRRPAEDRSVAAAMDRYLAAAALRLAHGTLALYRAAQARLAAAFVEFTDARQLKRQHVMQYLDACRDRPVQCNNDVRFLSAALSHVLDLGWIDANPCAGLRKHKQRPRRRVYSDAELAALREGASEQLGCLIELALLTALRLGDLLSLRLQHLTDEGLVIETRKTGARLCIQWTPALREAVERAKRLRRRVGSMYLLPGRDGRQWTTIAARAAWERLCRRVGVADAHLHDLRATALTWLAEAQGLDAAQRLAGHTSQRTTEGYVAQRATTKVRPIR